MEFTMRLPKIAALAAAPVVALAVVLAVPASAEGPYLKADAAGSTTDSHPKLKQRHWTTKHMAGTAGKVEKAPKGSTELK
jgi:hypothetical protein